MMSNTPSPLTATDDNNQPVADPHIAVVIPAHNEADNIAACLSAVNTAIEALHQVYAIPVQVWVVLDSCDDDTQAIVQAMSIDYLCCALRCVGAVRDLGLRHAIQQGANWLACTDADSQVAPDWLIAQVRHQPTEMICGVVSINDWAHLTPATKAQYLAHYQDTMGHQHIHGANLSFSAQAYVAVGGFDAIACHEDVGLVKKFQAQHRDITWSNQVRVTTSSRLEARADEGFAYFLNNLEAQHTPPSL